MGWPYGYVVPVLFFAWLFIVEAQDPFPFLRTAPDEDLLPAKYVLDSGSLQYLTTKRFNDFSAEIILNGNRTFAVTHMPHIWIDGTAAGSGYDKCSGTWSVAQDFQDVFNVTLQPDKKLYPSFPPLFLGLSPPKGRRKDYALAVAIFNGDFDYINFVRQ